MPEVVLGKTGLSVCRMGFGGIPIQRLSAEESDRVLEKAVASGINFFDSARIYTDSEAKLGRVLHRHRPKVVIATKTFSRDREGARRDLERALQELRTETIDLYQLHNVATEPDLLKVTGPQGALEALVQAKKEGKIRHIGLSGHKPPMVLRALRAFDFETIQVPFNYLETTARDELIPMARKLRVGIIAMKPIGGGNIREVRANFRFIFSCGIDVAIPGMDSVHQVKENLAALDDLAAPGPAELKKLDLEKERLGESFCRRCEYCLPCPQGLPIAFLHVLKNYYFLYDLKDWVWERLGSLPKTYKDCSQCRQCVQKCPYQLDNPEIFRKTWEAILRDRQSGGPLQGSGGGI